MNSLNKAIELFKLNFIDNKAWAGLVLIAFGILILIGAIRNWDWIFKPSPVTYSLAKLDGIINTFGRTTGRIVAGIGSVLVILFGIGWIMFCFYQTPFRWSL